MASKYIEQRGEYLGWALSYRTRGPLMTRWSATKDGKEIRRQCLEAIARGIEAERMREGA